LLIFFKLQAFSSIAGVEMYAKTEREIALEKEVTSLTGRLAIANYEKSASQSAVWNACRRADVYMDTNHELSRRLRQFEQGKKCFYNIFID